MIYYPLPLRSLWERLGYHCRVLVWFLALNAKLNWFLPKKQLQLLLEQPHAMFPRQLEANGRQWSHPGEDSRTRWLTTTGSQRTSATTCTNLYDLYCYNPITSANNTSSTSPCSLLLQHLLCLYCYSRYYAPMISTETATITSLWSILLQHLLRHQDLYITATILSLWSTLVHQLSRPYDPYCYNNY
jgi:hypothetical protein